MKRSLLGWLFCLALALMLTAALPTTASAFTEGDWTYTVADGKATVTGYTGSGTTVTIPASLGGYPVTAVGRRAFDRCIYLTDVTIPEGVTSIGDSAFYGCSGLTSVKIPSSVTVVEESAFSYCSSLQRVDIDDLAAWCGIRFGDGTGSSFNYANPISETNGRLYVNGTPLAGALEIPSGVTSIGTGAFCGFSELTSVTIPSSVTSIDSNAFDGCTGLKSLTLPGSIRTIGMYAFANCTGLTSVTIPSGISDIGFGMFCGCTGLTSVTISSTVTQVEAVAFENCTNLQRVDISDLAAWCRINFSGSAANPLTYAKALYLNGEKVTALTVPDSVASIGKYAFYGYGDLTSLTITEGVTKIGDWAFCNCKGLATLTLPDSVNYVSSRAFSNCSGLTSLTLGSGVTNLEENSFSYCTGLTSLTIPDSVRSIGSYTFRGCSKLKNVTLGSGLTYLGKYAFADCRSLTSLTIPSGVTALYEGVFSGCSALTRMTIPATIKSLGKSAFSGCTGLTGVTIPASISEIGMSAFSGCTGLTSVTIPNSVTTIGSEAFKNCSSLTSLELPPSVTSVGSGAFSGCVSLTEMALPSSMKTVPSFIFSGCTSLTGVTFPDYVQEIRESAFSGCTSLTTLTLPRTVLDICQNAFSGCTGLTSLVFPGVVRIASGAFSGCTNLAAAAIPEKVNTINQSTFSGCTGLTDIILPRGLKTVKANAFSGCGSLASVHYPGTAADWASVTLESGNEALTGAALCGVLSIRYTSKTVRIGESYRFTATNGMGDCSWFVGNESIAEVSADGTVTGMTSGNTYLYCRDSIGAEAKCLLKITQAPLSIRYSSKLITVGTPFAFAATGGSGSYSWRVEDPDIAAVDGDGTVTGIAEGSTTLYCSDSTGAEVRCQLNVAAPVSIRYQEKTIKAGESFRFTATGGSGTYSWRVGNTAVATVDFNGNVTGAAAGNTWLYCRDSYGSEVRCLLKINPLSIRYTEKTVSAGASFQFTATGGSGTYTWRVGNSSVATVDSAGKVTGKAAGNTYLYCRDSYDNEVKCLLRIK